MGSQEKKRYRINQKQMALLHLIYRFRFVTTELVARYQGKKSGATVYPRLATLVEQGYIGRKYEPCYKLHGQHAAYFLLPDGMRVLRRQPRQGYTYDIKLLHNIYKDKEASDQFVEHSLAVLNAYCDLKGKYGDNLQFFTKSDLANFSHFPQPLPDAYLLLKLDGAEKQYFLDVHHELRPFFVASRRVKQYAEYADSHSWQITETELPEILAVCDTPTIQKRLQKRMAKTTNPQLNFLLTTTKTLKQINQNAQIWQCADRPQSAVSLDYSAEPAT